MKLMAMVREIYNALPFAFVFDVTACCRQRERERERERVAMVGGRVEMRIYAAIL